MNPIPLEVERQMILDHLKSGWLLYLIEDRPYPTPHQVLLIHEQQRLLVSYSAFVSLNVSGAFIPGEMDAIDGKPARIYSLAE